MEPPAIQQLARRAYEAYNVNSGGKAWDGRPCPTWDELAGSPVRSHWCAAVSAILDTRAGGHTHTVEA